MDTLHLQAGFGPLNLLQQLNINSSCNCNAVNFKLGRVKRLFKCTASLTSHESLAATCAKAVGDHSWRQ